MIKLPKMYETVKTILDQAADIGIVQNTATNKSFSGRTVEINHKPMVNFLANGYMGFENDPRVIKASTTATETFGIHTSVSRTYLRFEEQLELEKKLERIYGLPAITCLTTTMGHFAVLPSLIGKNDAVILDQFVHSSVQMTAQFLKGGNIYVETLRHNQMEDLEKRIRVLSEKYDNVWYLADSIYSMHGDVAPLKDIEVLLNGYDNFYCYLDDAHGIGWIGENGKGFALNLIPYNPKLFMISSLNKGFGGFGAALVFPNEEMKQVINRVGTTLIFSTPPNHASIAANSAIADIHLSDEIYVHQNNLQSKIRYFLKRAKELNIPLHNWAFTPIFYVMIGSIENGSLVMKYLIENGFIASPASFPSVPITHSGIRLSLTVHHTLEDIDNLLTTISKIIRELVLTNKLNEEVIDKSMRYQEKVAVSVS